jgi:hypothetical protein
MAVYGCSGDAGMGSNEEKETDLVLNSAEEVPVSGETVTGLSGVLSYYAQHKMWGISHVIPGTIDSENVYLIKEFDDNLPKETKREVIFSGTCYPSDKTSPIGGLTIFYIYIDSLTNK